MGANTFAVTTMAGKDLWAKKNIFAYWGFTPENMTEKNKTAPIKFTVKAGDRVGKIYNYAYFKNNGVLYWIFKSANGKKYFVKHDETAFDIANLKKQGAKTIEQQQEEIKESDKSATDKIIDGGKKLVIGLAIGTGLVLLGKEFIKAKVK